MSRRMRSKWRTKEAVEIVVKAGLKALRTGGENILTHSIDDAPVESGTLRRSGTVTVGALPDSAAVYEAAEAGKEHKGAFTKELGKEATVFVSFNTPYARIMHEHLGYKPKLAGGPKYLESNFKKLKRKTQQYAQLQIKKALRKAK